MEMTTIKAVEELKMEVRKWTTERKGEKEGVVQTATEFLENTRGLRHLMFALLDIGAH